jgi:ABC-type multidrug transport system fused ATPase/permease subunit
MLQNALLRKFLNYAENCRKDLKSADLIMAMTRDTTNVVHEGYIKMLELTKCVTQLCMILLFQVTAPFVFPNGSFNPFGFIVLFIFPPILFTFLICRRHITTHHIGRRNDEQDNLVATVGRTVDNYRLVADFGQRPFFEERFQHRISEFNGAGKEAAQVLKNNGYFSPWVTILFTAYYIIVGGLEVVDGVNKPKSERLSLGMFLANLSIIATIGHSWGDIYKVLMDMQSISPALLSVVDLMNLPTDVPQRKALNRVRRIKSKDLREEMRSSGVKGHPADTMPIVLENLSYSYREPEATDEVAVPVATKGVLSTDIPPAFTMTGVVKFHQGHFTALVGPEGEGKSTLLKMLGGVILPTPGALFVPSHLRVLHVAKEDLFFKASLYDNLTFGCIPGDSDAELKRVCTICSRLGLPEDMMALVRQGSEGTVLTWGEVISQSQKSILGLARAVITNPELMCIHKPIMAYNEETSKVVLDMLKQFCIDKGVEQELESRHVRRPRTCIITAAKASSVKVADFVYWVSHKDGVRYISKSEANEMAFGGSGKSC